MIWKGFGVLAAAAVLIVVGVVGLAKLMVPDEPTFAEGFEAAEADDVGSLDFVPTAIGGELDVTGDREGTLTLVQDFSEGPAFGLSGTNGKIFFEIGPLSIAQLYFDDLAFFPEPEECDFEEGEYNEEVGLIAVRVVCEGLVDIRDNGTISIDGYAALPADMVRVLDLPEMGGTVMVGEVTFEPEDPMLFIGPTGPDDEMGLGLFTPDLGTGAEDTAYVHFAYDERTGVLTLSRVSLRRGLAEVEPGECDTEDEKVMVVNPQTEIWELTFHCDSVSVSSQGSIHVEGHVVYQRVFYVEP